METYTSSLLTTLIPFIQPHASTPDGEMLAHVLMGIAACEVRDGGPYRTDPCSDSPNLDLGFNLVIALFLRTLGVRLPNLDEYVQKRIAKKQPRSEFFAPIELAELIAHYQAPASDRTDEGDTISWTTEERSILTLIYTRLDWRLFALDPAFKRTARRLVERTIMGNPDKQMSHISFFMREALGKKGRRFSDHCLAELGLANVFFWTAFIIYDDFWDEDEAAEPRNLPVANMLARHYTGFFSRYLTSSRFSQYFHRTMDALDSANSWEIEHCRMRKEGSILHLPGTLPRYHGYDIKFHPAAGQILGPVSMLFELGYTEQSPEVEGLTAYFTHYLIAMQLNDDAHDWKEDIGRGHISTAIHALLVVWKQEHPERESIDLSADMRELEQLFWFKVLPTISESILERTGKAQRALDGLTCIEDPAPLQQFIDRNSSAAEEALAEQRRSVSFLEVIKTKGILQE